MTTSRLPLIIEKDGGSERVKDIYTRLLEDRIVFLVGEVNEESAHAVVAQLLYLAADDSERDIHMYITSPGGSVVDGLAILDTMQYIKPDVNTICIGHASSMGAFLLSAGKKGKRSATENARIMIHQPSGYTSGQVTDMEIRFRESSRYKKLLTDYMAKFTGQPFETVYKDCERDYYMSPEEALSYGIIDTIIKHS